MQRSQRDTQRRNDYAAFAANITNYLTNNNGNLPAVCSHGGTGICATGSAKKYVNPNGTDSAGKTYQIYVKDYAANMTAMTEMNQNATPQIWLIRKAKCGTNQGAVASSSGNRDFAVLGQLETGVFCQDNV